MDFEYTNFETDKDNFLVHDYSDLEGSYRIHWKWKANERNKEQIFLIPIIGESTGSWKRILKNRGVHPYHILARPMFPEEVLDTMNMSEYRLICHKYLSWQTLINDENEILTWLEKKYAPRGFNWKNDYLEDLRKKAKTRKPVYENIDFKTKQFKIF